MSGYTQQERRRVLLACCLSGFIAPLLSTMMNLSLVNIGEEFEVGSHMLAYVNTSFLLSSVVFMVPLAKLGDIIGKKRIYMIGVSTIAVAALMAPFSPSYWFLIACRAVMGAGAAAIVTTSVSMITDVYPSDHRGGALGFQTMCVYIGLAAGPPLGGILNDMLGWHSLFYVVVPLAVGSLVCISTFRHEIRPDAGGIFDGKGSVLYGLAIVSAMGGVINLPETWAFVALIVGVLFLVLFVRSQLRTDDRLLNVRLFRNRVFSGSCLAAFMNYAASYSISYFLALYLQSIGGLTATEAGLMMLIQPAIQAVGTPYFGRRSDIIADKRVLPTLGLLVSAVGIAIILTFGEDTPLAVVALALAVVGFGFSLFSTPNTSVIMGSVDPKETGEASAMVAVMRQTGMMVSMGIAMLFISLVMGSADNIAPENYGTFIEVMRYSFTLCLAMCLLGAVASMLRSKGRIRSEKI